MKNEYLPSPALVKSIRDEGADTKTFRVVFQDQRLMDAFDYQPGQFVQLSLLGVGEAPFSISSSPSQRGFLEFTVRAMGRLTRALHRLRPGDRVHIRGPYGRGFPVEAFKGRDLYFIAGGIGLAPLRSLINFVLDNRGDYGRLKVLYGARTPRELCFTDELERWGGFDGVEVLLTVDEPDGSWRHHSGVVTVLWDKTDISAAGGVACVCGPPIMIKFVAMKLVESGFRADDIYLTLERYMKCGIGKCGHCNIGPKFVCLDGPVFTYSELDGIPDKERAV